MGPKSETGTKRFALCDFFDFWKVSEYIGLFCFVDFWMVVFFFIFVFVFDFWNLPYIYIYRERERERERAISSWTLVSASGQVAKIALSYAISPLTGMSASSRSGWHTFPFDSAGPKSETGTKRFALCDFVDF